MLEDNNNKQTSTEEHEPINGLERLFDVVAENFPYPILLSVTDVGEVLHLVPHPLPERPVFQVRYREQIAGLIDLSSYPAILERARAGTPFEAVVSENYGGRCKVLIRPVAKA